MSKIKQTDDKNHPLHGKTGELNLLNILLDFFLAGSDTSSITINWAMLYLIQNPNIQTKMRQELISQIGPNKKAKMSDKSLTPFSEAFIHEVQRKGNILPLSVFHSSTKNINIGPYEIPPATIIAPMIGEIMNDPEHFTNPERFDPDRHLKFHENGDIQFTPNPRIIPFGVGKRRCLGEVLARMTLYKFITAIVQKYEIVSGQDEPIKDAGCVGFSRYPLPYKLIFKPFKQA